MLPLLLEINLLLSEVDAITPGPVQDAEFIELINHPSSGLGGFTLVVFDGATDTVVYAVDLDGYQTRPNGLFVAGGAGVSPPADLILPPDVLPDGGGAVGIYIGDAVDYPVGTPTSAPGLWEAVVWGPPDPGLAVLNGFDPMQEDHVAAATLHSSQRTPHFYDTRGAQWRFVQGPPTPGWYNRAPHQTNTFCLPTPNSVHPDGARLRIAGSGSISANDSVVGIERVPDTVGWLRVGRSMGEPQPFGTGHLCIKYWHINVGPVVPSGNTATVPIDLSASPFDAGMNLNLFQYLYRDGTNFTASEGMQVVFTP